MSDLIILIPPRLEQPWSWGLAGHGQWGNAESADEKAALAQLSFSRLIVVVPGTEVTTKLHGLEGLSNKQIGQAVGFSIEDDLAAPLEDTHLAFGPGQSRLAICSKSLMRAITTALQSHGLDPDLICADYNSVSGNGLFEYGGRLISVASTGLGHAVETNLASLVLDKDQQRPDPITADIFLEKVVTSIKDGHIPLNLRQGEFEKKANHGFGKFTRLAVLAACLVIAFVGLQAGQGLYYAGKTKQLNADIDTIYGEIFPGEDVPSNPVRDIARAQADLSIGAGTDFVTLSALLAKSVREVEGVEISSLRYDKVREQINLSLLYGSFDDAERLKQAVAKNGGNFTEGGTRQSGDGLIGDAVFQGGA